MIIVYFFLSLLAFHLLIQHWPRNALDEFLHRHRQLTHDMRKRGLSGPQMNQEFQFRWAMLELRSKATFAAIDNPGSYKEAIGKAAKEQAHALALVNPDTAKRFISVVDKAPLADILYPTALETVDSWLKNQVAGVVHITAADIAAVTTVR